VRVEISPWDSCVPDMACSVVCPEVFTYDPSTGRAVIREGFRGGEPWRGSVPGELGACAEAAAGVCPLKIIRVWGCGG
jgi:ferredoxin